MKIKKIIALLCAAVMLLATITACSSTSTSGEEQTWEQQLGQKGKLRVGISPDYPPFESYAMDANGVYTDEIVGLDVDIANHIANELGLELEFVVIEFDTIIMSLNSGVIDLGISCFSYREDRDVLFSETYYTVGQAVVVAADSAMETVEDLKGSLMAPMNTTGYYYAEELLKERDITVSPGSVQIIMQALRSGACDAVSVEVPVAQSYMNANPGVYKIINYGPEEEAKVVAKKGNDALMEKVNAVVVDLLASDVYADMVTKNMG